MTFDHIQIESKWRERWSTDNIYGVADMVQGRENFYILVEFPYPSGDLHVGHWYAFAVTDIIARFKRMQGYNVLFPIGFDAFGLPAENAAIKRGLNPKEWTYDNMDSMRKQFALMGASFDHGREIVTCDPKYYKWTQWLVGQLFENNLMYRSTQNVNWCPSCNTVLANEQVNNGLCDRCSSDVLQKEMPQWSIQITKYADRLIDDLVSLDWPESIKESQRNWIGRSTGAQISFPVSGTDVQIDVFTTRPDTLFGATYVVLAPEHALVTHLQSHITNWDEVATYIAAANKKSDLERQENKEKTGVELQGITAINPGTKEEVSIWIADYVLAHYGTGAIMAVPAHDERDYAFATQFNLPITHVVAKHFQPLGDTAERSDVETVNRRTVDVIIKDSEGNFYLIAESNGDVHLVGGGVEEGESLIDAVRREVIEETGFTNFEITGISTPYTNFYGYRIPKGLNQRTVGPAFEVVLTSDQREQSEVDEGKHTLVVVPESELRASITWEHHKQYIEWYLNTTPIYTGEGRLIHSGEFDGLTTDEAKEKIVAAVGGTMTNTYRLRDWSIGRQRYWGCPVPIVYDPQGKPHAIPEEHLPWVLPEDVDHTPDGTAPLARSKELKERTEKIFGKGWTSEVETMDTFIDSSWYYLRYADPNNIERFVSKNAEIAWLPVDFYSGGAEHTTMHLLYSRFFHKALFDLGLVLTPEPYQTRLNRGLILGPDGNKMSKSKGNVINPDDIVARLGADTVRTYLAFIGPYNEVGNYPWDTDGIIGVRRFIERVVRLVEKVTDTDVDTDETIQMIHVTIKKVGDEIETKKLNTAVAALMTLIKYFEKQAVISRNNYTIILQLLAPFAPHVTEELWEQLGETKSIHLSEWPRFDATKLISNSVTLVVQVNGKVRDSFVGSPEMAQQEAEKAAQALAGVQKYLAGKTVDNVIYVPGKLLNYVVK